jgi:GT2 family glycosyltransferase/ADP-heptose:LPS heptosyltransferase/predicted SAM-dependent methyltransferase
VLSDLGSAFISEVWFGFSSKRSIGICTMPERTLPEWYQLFDATWYLERYPDVSAAGIDPQDHYQSIGAEQGYDPHPLFDTSYYLERYPDVAHAALNPLEHFLKFGAIEKRHPHPLFDTSWYLERYPDIAAAGVNPLAHYLARGLVERRNPNPQFDSSRYLRRHPEVAATGVNPLVHFLTNRRRIQVHRRQALGDVLLTTPVLRALREKYPDYEIVESTDFPEILQGNPHIDSIVKSPKPLLDFDETFVLEYETQPDEHIVKAYAQIAHVSVADCTPEIYLSQDERFAANALLRSVGLRLGERFCVMQLTSGWSVRDWSISRFKIVAEAIERKGLRVVVLGLVADPVIDFGVDLRGKTSVRVAAAIIEKCAVMVTIDSSLMHMGYAFRRPVISLFGCTDPEKRVPDWALSSALYSDIICRGCHHRQRPVPAIAAPECPWETVRCMDVFSANLVTTKVWEALERAEKPLVSIAIPHYTNYPMLISCLTSIFRCGAMCSFEVVVVVDGSPAESRRQLEAWRPNVRIVALQPNRGFGGACNAGARAARGKYVVFLNDDTAVTPGWLDEMVAFIESNRKIGIVGPKLLYPETDGIQHCGTVFNERGLGEHIYRYLPSKLATANRPRFYRALTGACLLIDTDFFLMLGGFDTTYHGRGGCEDTDLCFKVLERDRMVAYCPGSVVYHHEGATRGLRDDFHPEDAYNRKLLLERWSKYLRPDISDYFLLAEIEAEQRESWYWLQDVPSDIAARYDSPDRRTTGRYPFKIQIGSGGHPKTGYLHLNRTATDPRVDIIYDLPGQLPFPDATVAEILANNVLERVPWPTLPAIFQDFYRVLEVGGTLFIRTRDFREIVQSYLETASPSVTSTDAITRAMHANMSLFGHVENQISVHNSCLDAEALRALITTAGFSAVHLNRRDLGGSRREIEVIAMR